MLSGFEGGVAEHAYSKMQPIAITEELLSQAVEHFLANTEVAPGTRSEVELLSASGFDFVEAWQGHLDERPFGLEIHHRKGTGFSLVVLGFRDHDDSET